MSLFSQKIENVILFFANKDANNIIERLKLIKLIWLSDRLHLNKYGRLITEDSYRAMRYGPVASKTLDLAKKSSDTQEVLGYNIKALTSANKDFFSKSDVQIMNYIWDKFGQLDTFTLRDYSHTYPEWKRFEEQLKVNNTSYNMEMEDFFDFPNNDFENILTSEEIKISAQIFAEHQTIQNFLKS